MRSAITAAVIVGLLALAGCGSLDTGDAEQTVRDFAKATRTGDGKTLCNDLVSHDYLEKTTFATGDNATAQCVKEIRDGRGIDVKLIRIKRAKVDGDKASVTAELEYQGATREQVFNLEKQDGRFKLVSSPQ